MTNSNYRNFALRNIKTKNGNHHQLALGNLRNLESFEHVVCPNFGHSNTTELVDLSKSQIIFKICRIKRLTIINSCENWTMMSERGRYRHNLWLGNSLRANEPPCSTRRTWSDTKGRADPPSITRIGFLFLKSWWPNFSISVLVCINDFRELCTQ